MDASAAWTQSPAPPPPPLAVPVNLPEAPIKPLRLWFGMLIPPVFFLLAIMAAGAGVDLHSAYFFFMLPGLIFYFAAIRRFILVLESQPGWNVDFTPAGVIWRQIIPFYGLYFLYRWTGDIESYLDWRLRNVARVGLFAFLGIMIGFMLARFVDVFLGQWIYVGSLYWIDIPLRRALKTPVPDEALAPTYNGSLRLT